MGSRSGNDAHWLKGACSFGLRSKFILDCLHFGEDLSHGIVRNAIFSGLESYCVELRRM